MKDKKERDSMPELFSPHQAADALGISPSGVFKAIQRGRLDIMRFGEVILIPRASIERYAATKKQGWPKGKKRKS